MAQTETEMKVGPERVWEVLADPGNYGYWVVGSKYVRDADGDFPAAGTRFHHAVGFGPITVKDHTEVLESRPPNMLKLKAKARPLGTALVTLEIRPTPGGSRMTMTEDPGDALTALVFNPLTHLAVRGRNVESLDRLRELAEGPAGLRT